MGKLAVTSCENAKPKKTGDRLLGDGDGLFLRIRPHGTKTWFIEYLFGSTRRKYTIGVYDKAGAKAESITEWLHDGRLSLAQARAIAGMWKMARRAGHDPIADWEMQLANEARAAEALKTAQAAEEAQPTVRVAADRFLAKMMAGKKSEPAIRYRLERLAATLGDKKIRDVTRQDVLAALDAIAAGAKEGKTAKQLAGEVLTVAKRLWRYAELREWIETSPIEKLTRAGIDARPRKRDVALRLDELAELWRVLDDPKRCKADPVTIAALKLIILTGQREDEAAGAEWNEFDLDAGLWKIPAQRTKSKRANLVHLAPQAVVILEEVKKLTGHSRYVFASPLKDKQPIYGRSANNALATLFKGGHLPNVTRCHVHDLRRTLITRLPDLGFDPFVGHKIANHVLPGVLGIYNHAEYLPEREKALLTWAARIEAMAAASNVRQLHRAA